MNETQKPHGYYLTVVSEQGWEVLWEILTTCGSNKFSKAFVHTSARIVAATPFAALEIEG